ncbi:helix-turn-helix DNA binding protein [Gordonia phage Guacamole]|uniref:transcriptional repressor n=1 Tax=Gordonia phage Guacamole TaxID=1821553 RepID=UPI00078BB60C|nr:transcriptional repressor [Gordonia phage Guacamole]AMS03532.1 helix-turn-helix DNA binding protein [Gordonia phage Guacamole]QDM56778.1 helix-turn-helix DNA binding protein [Gordonia phage JasperJr]
MTCFKKCTTVIPMSHPPRAQIGSATVAANVRAELARRQVAAQQLAEGIGLSRVTLSRRLNGHAPWTIDEIAATAEFLNVPVESLIGAEPKAVPA